MRYTLITDGAYSSQRNCGGIGLVILRNGRFVLSYSKSYQNTTNHQMELVAIITGLRCIKKPVESLAIISDSMYCIGCASLGWRRSKNIWLWNLFDKEFKRVLKLCNNIRFQHVRGHQKDLSFQTKWNNVCDFLATGKTLCGGGGVKTSAA